MKRRILCAVMAIVMVVSLFSLSGCGSKLDDWDYIEDKGEMTIGITLFAPMNYYDDSNNLIGFETEFATAVCEKLGVKANFQVIDWGAKENELNAKNIDCIWNGMTITEERLENMDISNPYMRNKQVLVTLAENASVYNTAEAMNGLSVVAEVKSAGDSVATSDAFFAGANYTAVDTQSKTLTEVKAGTADAAVIDYVMSIGSIGEGTDYADLAVVEGVEFSPEEYGIAFRKNSPETLEKVNGAIAELYADGTLTAIAAKYKLDSLLIAQ